MNLFLRAIAGAASLVVCSASAAQSDLVSSYARWEARLRHRVDDLLLYPIAARRGAAGDVLVGFQVNSDGKPADIVIRKASGEPIFDQAAIDLVARLGRIGKVPSADGSVREIILKLSYGDPSTTAAQSMRLAKADRQEQLANERRDRAIISVLTHVAQRP
jgi:TonB family protein